MYFNERIVASPFAFYSLTSEDGAWFFQDIKKYTSYSRAGNVVTAQYPTLGGTVTQEMTSTGNTIEFKGTGPMGVTFDGTWTHTRGSIELEQRVHGLPALVRFVVEKRIRRVLHDLESI